MNAVLLVLAGVLLLVPARECSAAVPDRVEKTEAEWKALHPRTVSCHAAEGDGTAFSGKYWDFHEKVPMPASAAVRSSFPPGTSSIRSAGPVLPLPWNTPP